MPSEDVAMVVREDSLSAAILIEGYAPERVHREFFAI
jgi:hypothetical protein